MLFWQRICNVLLIYFLPLEFIQCDQIDFFQPPRFLGQNVKKRQGKFLASRRNDRICDKLENLLSIAPTRSSFREGTVLLSLGKIRDKIV